MFRRFLAKQNKRIRIQFVDHESLKQFRQFVVKPGFVWVSGLLSVLAVVAGTASLIVLTPSIRQNIPGYMNPELEIQHLAQKERYDSLLAKTQSQASLLESMTNVHGNGNEGSLDDLSFEDVMAEANMPTYDYAENNEQGSPANVLQEVANRPIEAGASPPVNAGYQVMNLIPPLLGTVSSTFKPNDSREKHFGVDIVANNDAMISAIANGFVIFSEYSNQTGYVIGIAHANGLISFYKHNSRVFKKAGSYVFAGEAIAVIGNSGENTTGPHLHFELWFNGKPVDPEEYIAFRR